MSSNPRKCDSVNSPQQYTKRPTIAELKDAAVGRWIDILDAAGIPANLLDGRGHPCPRCGGRDRFAAWRDVPHRGSVQCRQCFNAGTDPGPGDGIATLRWALNCDTATACQWLAGWLGLSDDPVPSVTRPPLSRTIVINELRIAPEKLNELAERCYRAMKPSWRDRLAERLGLPADVLDQLRVGWLAESSATAWPMLDHNNNVVGVRLRSMDTGDKWSVKGGTAGVFVPAHLPPCVDRLFIAEGPTDCGALLSIGFTAIGRPSSNGAVAITTKIVKRMRPNECVIVADDDDNSAGKRGAESLASTLVLYCPRLRIIYPPAGINDARDWVHSGATADDIIAVVDAADLKMLSINMVVAS